MKLSPNTAPWLAAKSHLSQKCLILWQHLFIYDLIRQHKDLDECSLKNESGRRKLFAFQPEVKGPIFWLLPSLPSLWLLRYPSGEEVMVVTQLWTVFKTTTTRWALYEPIASECYLLLSIRRAGKEIAVEIRAFCGATSSDPGWEIIAAPSANRWNDVVAYSWADLFTRWGNLEDPWKSQKWGSLICKLLLQDCLFPLINQWTKEEVSFARISMGKEGK